MPDAHTEAVQALLRIIEAEGRIAIDAEKAQADLLVAAVEARDLARATVVFRHCLASRVSPSGRRPGMSLRP
jgi:hypothetical protein